jgi:autotransporter-associated beta strand protein
VKVTKPGLLVLLWLASAPWAAAQTFNIGANFGSVSGGDSGDVNLVPPDSMGSVGPQNWVTFVNGQYRVYNKLGTQLQTQTDTGFWQAAGLSNVNNLSDPRILYDPVSSRWFAVQITINESTNNRILIGRSDTSNPAGSWQAVTLTTSNNRFADQPTLGLDANGLYVSTNNFTSSTGSFSNVGIYSVPKADLLASTPSLARLTSFANTDATQYGFSLQPAVNFASTVSETPIVSTQSGQLVRSTLTGTTAAGASLSTTTTINVASTSNPPPATQPNGQSVQANDVRLDSTVYRIGDLLYLVHGTNQSGRAAVRWTVLNSSTNAVVQEGTISDPNLSFYYPSIAVNKDGDAVIAFSGSSSSQFIASYAVASTAGSTLNFGAPVKLTADSLLGNYGVSFDSPPFRWGDYSATNVDPADPGIFWTIQERSTTTSNRWQTQVTEIIPTKAGEIRWKAAADGNWTDSANWFNGAAPGPTDHAIYSREGTPYTITFSPGSTANDRASIRQGTVTFNIPGGSYSLTNGTTATPSLSIAEFQGIANLTISGGGTVQSVHTMLAGTAGGSGTLTVTGAPTAWANSGNVFVGGTSTAAGGTGTINVAAGASAMVGGTMTLWNSASAVTVNGATLSVAGLSNAPGTNPTVTLTDPAGGTALTVTHGQGTSYSGMIAGTGSVVKSGSGAWALAGANTYSGGTTVSGGTLQATNATGSATGSGSVTVQASGTLAGTGAVVPDTGTPANNRVTVAGTVQPGLNIATGYLTLGSASATARVQVNGAFTWTFSSTGPSSSTFGGSDTNDPTNQSRLVVNGDLTMTPATFNVVGLSGLSFNNSQPYSWRVATGTGTVITGATQPTFTVTGLNTGGGSFFLSGGAGAVVLGFSPISPVPEPATILILCVLACGTVQMVRRLALTS